MMNKKDAERIVKALTERPFVCSNEWMELDNGYVIVKKEYFKKLERMETKQKSDCTKPPDKPRPSFCGKMPRGSDCYICEWNGRRVK